VEACLIEYPAVFEAAVIGSPDKDGLIKHRAFVVLHKGYAPTSKLEKELKEYIKTKLAHYKYPRWINFVDELPKTATGKIKRFMLKDYPTSNPAAA
jgi:4-hydroxybenzoate-CoA ligase